MLAQPELRSGASAVAAASPAKETDVARCETLFAEHHSAVYRLCLSRLRNPEDAEDATQETFARAVGLGANVGEGWLITVARNVCIDNLRRQSHGLTVLSTDEDIDPGVVAVRQDAPDVEVVGRAAIRQLLEQLTTAERRVVAATVLEDRSHVETARELGIASGTSRALLSRATRKMRSYLTEHPEMLGVQVALPVARVLRRVWSQARTAGSMTLAPAVDLALPGVIAVVAVVAVAVAAGPSWAPVPAAPASVARNSGGAATHAVAPLSMGGAGPDGGAAANPDRTQRDAGPGGSQPASVLLTLLGQPAPVVGSVVPVVTAGGPSTGVHTDRAPLAPGLPQAPALPKGISPTTP